MKKMWIVTLFVILLGMTLSCGLLAVDTSSDQLTEVENESDLPDQWPDDAENSLWPTYLPHDIPVLDADISIVMGSPETNVRIFFAPLTETQIEQYVELCKKNGFTTEYLVYSREGFPDNTTDKMKAGDFDAVEITKGDYFMRLEYGSELVTLDIHIANATPQEKPPSIPWPEDIKASVPQPEQCFVRNIANLSYGGYQIVCEYEDGNLRMAEYLQVLTASGFQETDRLINDNNEIVHLILENASLSVKLMPHSLSSTLTLQVLPKNP